jgi:cellulose synthase/poly-beta-1,6-N-acetylglucosamine synthase-like glycosyltransferase
VLWTEVPERMRDLGRQRDRWHRGLIEVLQRHKHMMFRPRYGRTGMVAIPYLYLLEMLGPLVEFLGYFSILFSVFAGITSSAWLLGFLFLALFFGVAVSIASVALEELCFRRYPKFSDLLRLFGIAVLENFGHRQIVTFWRVFGFFSYLRGKKGWGGSLQRVGFSADAAVPSVSARGG